MESYSPTWSTGGCVVTAAELQEKGIDFRLVDSDVVADDTITPLIHSSVSLVALGLGSLTVAPASGGCKTIAFDFTEQ
ncbi:MAG: hypothetical protein EXR79_17020 [Myxococcales bacterium]|nr:hypothetical protein [Myxococcales bacterium]